MRLTKNVSLGILLFAAPALNAEVLLRPSADLPVTVFNVTCRVGSADDPKGAEGLAYVTGRLLKEGGVRALEKLPARKREEIEETLYPYAADISASVAKEQTSVSASASAADAATVFDLIMQSVLVPEFQAAELERVRTETLDALTKRLPQEDEEELGKAALEQAIYGKAHPYGHSIVGTTTGVKSLQRDQLVAFHKKYFTKRRCDIGIAGVIPKELQKKAKHYYAMLPSGTTSETVIPPALKSSGIDLTIVKGPFEATGVHIGTPLPVTRRHPDFPSLYLTATAFGKHRSFVGRLMREVRELRGLNYGAYSYVEDFPDGGHTLIEPTQAARSRQAFTVWGRPSSLENGCFLARQLVREVRSLGETGLADADFALGQSHLVGNIPLLATGIDRALGYAMDSHFYRLQGDYLKLLQTRVQSLQRAKVNLLLAKYMRNVPLHLVVVTKDPDAFRKEILSKSCPIHYAEGISKPEVITKEDDKIASFPISPALKAENIRVITAESVFEP